jgi:20S proteasome alpha/beta subunit
MSSKYLRKRPKRNPVTIIVGIKCGASIVLASDSQTTLPDHSKRRDAEKITVVKFKGDDKALVVQSGYVQTSARIIDVMARLAATRENDSKEAVLKTVQDAFWEVRTELRRQHFNCSAEDFGKVVFDQGLQCSLMVAHFYGNTPFLHSFDFETGTVTPSHSQYESLGCGSALANYLLGELVSPEMDSNFGKALAVYVVEKTIENVNNCDKPIRLAVLHSWKPHFIRMGPDPNGA